MGSSHPMTDAEATDLYLSALLQLTDGEEPGSAFRTAIRRDLAGFRGTSPYGNSTPYPPRLARVVDGELGPVWKIAEAMYQESYGPACLFLDDSWCLRIDFESDCDAVHFLLRYL